MQKYPLGDYGLPTASEELYQKKIVHFTAPFMQFDQTFTNDLF
ncbi:hypothetical protein [Cytobacillus horneckiae]|nr:hypothetical protein [Cytobacillus horneckiae]MEC1155795.1 hypothetical protein [Cytobacillus horneckiae]